MLGNGIAYIFADPFGRIDSGVSSYVSYSLEQLKRKGQEAICISRKTKERLSEYRSRLALEVSEIKSNAARVIVEAPESDASTADIPTSIADIHIRLHCSRQLGSYLQNKDVCKASLQLEQTELDRACLISAPSRSAIIATKLLFTLPDNVSAYPNPTPSLTASAKRVKKNNYVLFVGRIQQLKGVRYLEELANRMPEIEFVAACPTQDRKRFSSKYRNLCFVDGSHHDKASLYANAGVVVVLSLYETASMVGIEAMCYGVPVISWDHLGLAEYSDAPMLKTVSAFSVSALSTSIVDVLGSKKPTANSLELFESRLNNLFCKGLLSSIDNHTCDLMPISLTPTKTTSIINTLDKIKESEQLPVVLSTPPWRRKLRKLQNNPKQFFKDARIINSIVPLSNTKSITVEKKRKNTISSLKTVVDDKNISPALSIARLSESMPSMFCEIQEAGKITFQNPPQKPKGLISCFLYPEDMIDTAFDLLDGFNANDDFKYFHQPFLQQGLFYNLQHCSARDLINRIDVSNKDRISSVDNIFLLNPAPALVECLRSCGTRQRIIVILNHSEAQIPNPWYTDVLITVGSGGSNIDSKNYWRRKIDVDGHSDLPLAMRRAVQEGVPKSPDLLLPMLGFKEKQRKDLLSVDVNYFQGLIVMPPEHYKQSGTMHEICTNLARHATEIAVCESIYLRYRSLFDRVDDVKERAHAISYCLHDGVIFDVRS